MLCIRMFWPPHCRRILLRRTCAFPLPPVSVTCKPNRGGAFFLLQLPIVTRAYVTLSFLTTAACALEVGYLVSLDSLHPRYSDTFRDGDSNLGHHCALPHAQFPRYSDNLVW